MRLDRLKETIKLDTIERDVYDIEVDDTHTFFANDILVHNTDSMFLHIDPILKVILGDSYDDTDDDVKIDKVFDVVCKCAEYINNTVIKEMLVKHNTPSDQSMAHKYDFNFKEEYVFKRAIYRNVKKKYAAWVVSKERKKMDEISITGIEIVRSDFPIFTREMMEDFIEKILRHGYNRYQIIDLFEYYIDKYKELLMNGDLKAATPKKWGLRDYAVETQAIKGMKIYNIIYGNTFKPGHIGYVFNVKDVVLNKIPDINIKLQKMIEEDLIDKKEGIRFITIPENEKLDISIFTPAVETMLQTAVYNRLEDILDTFEVSIDNIDNLGF